MKTGSQRKDKVNPTGGGGASAIPEDEEVRVGKEECARSEI